MTFFRTIFAIVARYRSRHGSHKGSGSALKHEGAWRRLQTYEITMEELE